MEAARRHVFLRGPLAVDRHHFAELITERIEGHPNIELVRAEVTPLMIRISFTPRPRFV